MKHPEFAHRFREAVSRAGVKNTQKFLSKYLGVSEVMIWSYKNGEKLPRMSTAIRISDRLGVSVQWLLQGFKSVEEDRADYRVPIKYVPSTQAIIDFVEELNEPQKEKALEMLRIAFRGSR